MHALFTFGLKTFFYEIGELCGGWIAMEEETELKNHRKWARILVVGDGQNVPNEVVVEREGVLYFIPVWVERKPRFEIASTATRKVTRVPIETMFPASPNHHWTESNSADKEVPEIPSIRDLVGEREHKEGFKADSILEEPDLFSSYKQNLMHSRAQISLETVVLDVAGGNKDISTMSEKSVLEDGSVSQNTRFLNGREKRRVVKSLIWDWKADIICFQETKLEGEIKEWINQIWGQRWIGAYTRLANLRYNYRISRHITGVDPPNYGIERRFILEETSAVSGILERPWVVCADFNITRYALERKNCSRRTREVIEFSDFI
ncbi:hypothetical protein MTR67_018416 [Solanum verrucosum]|uniref:Endonuclease/exonuclease/phosphatase domain-containing protein n=1 Tax=Solanum verrucosum TaxID=315347 RepID=A0AAF0QQR4_SOLVR|nr:hypothetical protein MTR67_018416 [Solanum verrucosum]